MDSLRTVVFDLDDTLIDSSIDYEKMARLVGVLLQKKGLPTEVLDDRRKIYLIIRGGEAALLEHGVAKDQVSGILDFMTQTMNRIELEALDTIKPRPNARKTLKLLSEAGLVLGVATRSHRTYAEKAMERTGMLSYFSVLIARDDVVYAKPDPRHLLEALRMLRVGAGDALFVGDTPTDLETARAADVRFIGYKRNEFWARRLLDAGCEICVNDLLEVAELALNNLRNSGEEPL